jgi:propionate CoA-transferase
MAQVDRRGNVNVSRYGSRVSGVGGFVNITQTAKQVVFCGTFTAGGLKVSVEQGRLAVAGEGRVSKFVDRVQQISFSAERALEIGQEVLYVTERAVFRLAESGIELVEVAPGIDMRSQVLALMEFKPIVGRVKTMPKEVFE